MLKISATAHPILLRAGKVSLPLGTGVKTVRSPRTNRTWLEAKNEASQPASQLAVKLFLTRKMSGDLEERNVIARSARARYFAPASRLYVPRSVGRSVQLPEITSFEARILTATWHGHSEPRKAKRPLLWTSPGVINVLE